MMNKAEALEAAAIYDEDKLDYKAIPFEDADELAHLGMCCWWFYNASLEVFEQGFYFHNAREYKNFKLDVNNPDIVEVATWSI